MQKAPNSANQADDKISPQSKDDLKANFSNYTQQPKQENE
jgi:hypothetical protein